VLAPAKTKIHDSNRSDVDRFRRECLGRNLQDVLTDSSVTFVAVEPGGVLRSKHDNTTLVLSGKKRGR